MVTMIRLNAQPHTAIIWKCQKIKTVDTGDACQSTVHFNIGNIYQTAEQVVCKVAAICIVETANLMTEGYLIIIS